MVSLSWLSLVRLEPVDVFPVVTLSVELASFVEDTFEDAFVEEFAVLFSAWMESFEARVVSFDWVWFADGVASVSFAVVSFVMVELEAVWLVPVSFVAV